MPFQLVGKRYFKLWHAIYFQFIAKFPKITLSTYLHAAGKGESQLLTLARKRKINIEEGQQCFSCASTHANTYSKVKLEKRQEKDN